MKDSPTIETEGYRPKIKILEKNYRLETVLKIEIRINEWFISFIIKISKREEMIKKFISLKICKS